MTTLNQWLAAAGIAAVLALGAGKTMAQTDPGDGPGNGGTRSGRNWRNMSPEERQQRTMDSVKEQLEIKDDAEWKVVQPLIQKVIEARREIGFAGPGRGMIMLGRGPRGGGDNPPGDQSGRRNFGPPPTPEQEALQKLVESKASSAEIKKGLAKYLDGRKTKQAALEKAQAELRKVLSVRQEAIASLSGLL